jgi:DMSO/TMAO reductase YedYZ molybdopterin-dependent catalytic subunit
MPFHRPAHSAGNEKGRVPPGQRVTEKFPVLHYGSIPSFDPQTWDFRIFGLVEEPLTVSYDEFLALPTVRIVANIHCVTGWSKLDTLWEGVSFQEVIRLVQVKAEAKFVTVHCEQGFTTSLPREVLMDDDVLFAYRYDDAPLTPEHGYPLRLVVPKRYFWKSAKWVRGLEFMAEDRLGFWEVRGYHNSADPWKEERYA